MIWNNTKFRKSRIKCTLVHRCCACNGAYQHITNQCTDTSVPQRFKIRMNQFNDHYSHNNKKFLNNNRYRSHGMEMMEITMIQMINGITIIFLKTNNNK